MNVLSHRVSRNQLVGQTLVSINGGVLPAATIIDHMYSGDDLVLSLNLFGVNSEIIVPAIDDENVEIVTR